MNIIYGKELSAEENLLCQKIAVECGILFDTARLLLYRGIDSVKKAKDFLSPGKNRFNNPFLLNGMKEAVSRIIIAKEKGENLLIFGDYDADGICATATLYYALRDFGVNPRTVIPEREEGYGLNVEKIKALNAKEKIDLLITVDCGISDSEKIKELKEIGIDVIVTDHHEPPEEMLCCTAINPKLSGQEYPFNGLCGAGVAYKLAVGLIGEKANDYLDFVALATVADSMDLIGENRDIVVEGLKIFNSKHLRNQFKKLLGDNARHVTAQTLAYTVAPRINAGGRMGNANLALNLFLSENQTDIFDYTVKLSEYNLARQVECDKIYKEAKDIVTQNGLENDQIILVSNQNWSAGFIGIVAAKLVEDYSRPVIVFAGHDGYLKGSARSVDGINIYDAISYAKDLLLGFGGHSQAAGISVEKANFELLRKKLNEFVESLGVKLDLDKKFYAEWNISGEFSLRFAREIDMLEPFGVGNRKPLFTTDVGAVQSLPLKEGSAHYSYKTSALEILDFNGAGNVLTLSLPVNKKVLFEINLSNYKNKQSLKGYSRYVLAEYGDYSSVKPHIFANELENIVMGTQAQLEKIDAGRLSEFVKIGTVFALSNPDNLAKYKELENLQVYLYEVESKNCSACVVISPKKIPAGFNTVVYLDAPYALLDGAKGYLVGDLVGYQLIDNLSIDRSTFTEYFIKLKAICGKPVFSVADFCQSNLGESDLYQFIFATTVFIELGIFCVKNKKLAFNANVKNPLTNSKVYSKICLLKG